MNKPTRRELLRRLEVQRDVRYHPLVVEATRAALKDRETGIAALMEQLTALDKPKARKPRIPPDCPQAALGLCSKFWGGTTARDTFLIVAWNDRGCITRDPATGYSDNGGWNPCPPSYYVLAYGKTGNRRTDSQVAYYETSRKNPFNKARAQEWLALIPDSSEKTRHESNSN